MKQRHAFVLPLVLIFLLVGGILISVSFDIATKSQNQAMQMVTTGTLYNAAQDGIEWGKSELLKHKGDLDQGSSPDYTVGVSDLSDLYATYDDGNPTHPTVWNSGNAEDLNARYEKLGIRITVQILDCNYSVSDTSDTPSAKDDLPPLMPSNGIGRTPDGSSTGFRNGTTAIMDPYRNTTSGTGGYTRHYYVIRSTAKDKNSNREKRIETMVVINR